jgi:cell division protein YceG involved in septum cleavage
METTAATQPSKATPAPKKKKPHKKVKDMSVTTVTLITIYAIGLIYLIVISFLYFQTKPVDVDDDTIVSVIIVQDDSLSTIGNLKEVAQILKEEDLIRSKTAFVVKSFFMGEYCKIQDKEYELSPNMSAEDIILALSGE